MQNKIEQASELAEQKLITYNSDIELYVTESNGDTRYTEEAQDLFNIYYDEYLSLLQLDDKKFTERMQREIISRIQHKGKTYGNLDEEIYIDDFFVMVKGTFTYTEDSIGFDCDTYNVSFISGDYDISVDLNPSLIDFYE
jgi:hypothetical protein